MSMLAKTIPEEAPHWFQDRSFPSSEFQRKFLHGSEGKPRAAGPHSRHPQVSI